MYHVLVGNTVIVGILALYVDVTLVVHAVHPFASNVTVYVLHTHVVPFVVYPILQLTTAVVPLSIGFIKLPSLHVILDNVYV